jgi:trk system potassium uptake protein TrkA
MIKGLDQVDISSVLKFGTRLFTINAGSNEAVTIEELKLPESTRIIFYYRDETLHFVDEDTRFKKGDEIIVLCNTDTLPELIDRYSNG